jgi:hypothetical protein
MAEGPIGLYTCLRTQALLQRGNCKEARWDPLTGRPRMTASRDGPAIDLATADRELARFDMKYSAGPLSHQNMMCCIELYATEVIPLVREMINRDSDLTRSTRTSAL